MNQYYDEIVESLTINDLKILGILNDNNADVKFKSLRKSYLKELSGMSISDFRKILCRLESVKFIEIVTGQKEHKIFITDFGKNALFNSLLKEEI